MSNRDDIRRLAVSITDFLREQCASREDLSDEDKESLRVAIECLETVYEVNAAEFLGLRSSRQLADVFAQALKPVKIKDKLQADRLKTLGNENMLAHNYQEAEEAYTAAIELDKWNAIYYCNRAAARIGMSNYSAGISDCRQAVDLNPDYAKAHAKMGQAYVLMDQPRRAVRCFRQAVLLDPENETYRNNLSTAEQQSNEVGQFRDISTIMGPDGRLDPGAAAQIPGWSNDATEFFNLGQNLMRLVMSDIAASPPNSGFGNVSIRIRAEESRDEGARNSDSASPTTDARSDAGSDSGNHARNGSETQSRASRETRPRRESEVASANSLDDFLSNFFGGASSGSIFVISSTDTSPDRDSGSQTCDHSCDSHSSDGEASPTRDDSAHLCSSSDSKTSSVTKDATHTTSSDLAHPTNGDPAHPTNGDPAHPTNGDPAHPAISNPAHPTISNPAHPAISNPAHPTISNPAQPTKNAHAHATDDDPGTTSEGRSSTVKDDSERPKNMDPAGQTKKVRFANEDPELSAGGVPVHSTKNDPAHSTDDNTASATSEGNHSPPIKNDPAHQENKDPARPENKHLAHPENTDSARPKNEDPVRQENKNSASPAK